MTKSKIFDLKLQEKTGRFLQIVQGIKNHESRYRLRVPNWRNDLHIGSVYYGEKRGCLHEETKKFPEKIFREIKRRYRSVILYLFNVFSVIQRNMSRLTRKDQRRGVKVDCIYAS